jgi:putative sterol carrier protein
LTLVHLVVGAAPFRDLPVDDGRDDEITLTAVESVAAELASGGLDPNVAFMQGRLKTAGDNGAVLSVLPHLTRAAWAGA